MLEIEYEQEEKEFKINHECQRSCGKRVRIRSHQQSLITNITLKKCILSNIMESNRKPS